MGEVSSLSQLSTWLSVFMDYCCQVEKMPLCIACWILFLKIMNRCWILWNAFSASKVTPCSWCMCCNWCLSSDTELALHSTIIWPIYNTAGSYLLVLRWQFLLILALEIEPRTLHLLAKCSTASPYFRKQTNQTALTILKVRSWEVMLACPALSVAHTGLEPVIFPPLE